MEILDDPSKIVEERDEEQVVETPEEPIKDEDDEAEIPDDPIEFSNETSQFE